MEARVEGPGLPIENEPVGQQGDQNDGDSRRNQQETDHQNDNQASGSLTASRTPRPKRAQVRLDGIVKIDREPSQRSIAFADLVNAGLLQRRDFDDRPPGPRTELLPNERSADRCRDRPRSGRNVISSLRR